MVAICSKLVRDPKSNEQLSGDSFNRYVRILLTLVDRLMSGKGSFYWMLVLKMRVISNCSFNRLGILHSVG